MQEGDPQIHLAGNEPGAGTWLLKSIRAPCGTASRRSEETAVQARGTPTKVRRFIVMSFRDFSKWTGRVDVRYAFGEGRRPLVWAHPVEQNEIRTNEREFFTQDLLRRLQCIVDQIRFQLQHAFVRFVR